jgi:hypothetical protein
MPFDKHILVYAENPAVRRTQELMLKDIGFNVIAVGTMREVEYVASRTIFDLMILAWAVSEENKKRAAQTIKLKIPGVKILEICNLKACVDNPDYTLHTSSPEDLVEMIKSIFNIKGKRARI